MQPTRQNVLFLLLGVLLTLSAILLTGAAGTSDNAQIGRYRMTAIMRGNFSDLFVIDTTTGVVKWVGNDEGKPFDQIDGR